MDASFGNNQGSNQIPRDNGRNKLMNEIMNEMQLGTNMPNSGASPIMNIFGENPGMNPGLGPGGTAGPGGSMGLGGPGGPIGPVGHMGAIGAGQNHGPPQMGGQLMPGGPYGFGPQMAGPMGNQNSNPILGTEYPFGEVPEDEPEQYQIARVPSNSVREEEEEYEDDEGQEGEDIEINEGSQSMVDYILETGKEPLIGAIILMLLLTPQFTSLFNQLLPRISENLLYSLLAKGLIFFVIFYLVQRFL